MESLFSNLDVAVNPLSEFISVDMAFAFNLLVAPPFLALQHYVIMPLIEFFSNLL